MNTIKFNNNFGLLINIFIFFIFFIISNNSYANDPNNYFRKQLNGDRLDFVPAKVGNKIMLNYIIVMPRLDENGLLVLEFNRDDLTESFINDLFYSGEKMSHIFTNEGFEPILTSDKFILKVHSGVIFHLRNDMGPTENYSTFNKNDVYGTITEIRGNVVYSPERLKIKKKLNDVYVKYSGINIKLMNSENEIKPVDLNTIDKNSLLPKYYDPIILEK